MYKLMIADDEPKIRRRIADMLDWPALGIEIAAFAENGRRALEVARAQHIDLCLVDISMPFVSGLDFIEQIRAERPDMLCIILTGHDEFDYAQRSIKLQVFDYLLKPLNTDAFQKCIVRAVEKIAERERLRLKQSRAMELVKQLLPELRAEFLRELIDGALSNEEIALQRDILSLNGKVEYDFFLMPWEGALRDASIDDRDTQILRAIALDVMKSTLGDEAIQIIDRYGNLVSLVRALPDEAVQEREAILEAMLSERLGGERTLKCGRVPSLMDVPVLYASLMEDRQTHLSPVIRQVLGYIHAHYADSSLTLSSLTAEFHISASYLSRLFRLETGMTFIEYLIRVRIQNAIKLLDVTDLRIYEIADKVGYSSQHYFCSAFKRVLGITPSDYRTQGGADHVVT